jgi:hypothetical protein
MDESLTEQRRVSEEGFRIVKLCCQGRTALESNCSGVTVPEKKAPANYVPAAAVIRRGQALSGIIGRKARAGGSLSLVFKPGAQPGSHWKLGGLSAGEESGIPRVAVKCVEMWRNTSGEGGFWAVTDAEARKRGEQTGLDTLVVHAVNDEC